MSHNFLFSLILLLASYDVMAGGSNRGGSPSGYGGSGKRASYGDAYAPRNEDSLKCTDEQVTNNKVSITNGKDYLGLCGTISFRNLLTQLACKTAGSECFTPSLVELSQLFLESKLAKGNAYNDVSQVLQSKGIFDNSCVPIQGIYRTPAKEELQNGDWLELNTKLTVEVASKSRKDCPYDMYLLSKAMTTHNLAELDSIAQIVDKGIYETQKKHLESKEKKCQRHTLPPFKLVAIPFNEVSKQGEVFSETAKKLILSGADLSIVIQAQSGKSLPTPHVVTLVNSRLHCCQNKCQTQYQTMDDTQLGWTKGDYSKGGWVDESLILKLMGQVPGGTSLTYLELKK